MSRTIVFFHAHPDDEVLLTGGTMARLSAEGHRVVLVTATAGEAGLVSTELSAGEPLGTLRLRELHRSARALGCARVVVLGYADSGMAGQPRRAENAFADAVVERAARRVAEVLDEESADVLSIYDPAGGYGHPDHVQVHRVGLRAAELAGTLRVLEATVDRRALQRALHMISWAVPRARELEPARYDALFSAPERITHCVDVTGWLAHKRAAMWAHTSQTTADGATRSLAWFLRLPRPLYRLVFGREWFVEHGREPTASKLDDVLFDLR
ncbi:MAG: PIG-L family deacetylase [Jatrophihabitantaceae bacterium]